MSCCRDFILLIITVLCISCQAKDGCTDAASPDYSPEAEIDDGSCGYETVYITPRHITSLDIFFEENSGFAYDGHRLWTIHDQGGDNEMYSMDTVTGKRDEVIILENVENEDYEAIKFNDGQFYVGDIGNNNGEKKYLSVYRFSPPEYIQEINEVTVDEIEFYYGDRHDMSSSSETAYDAEAFVVIPPNIYVFTKNHKDHKTKVYRIPDQPGRHEAKVLGEFNTEGMVTDAAVNEKGDSLYLLGHNNDRTFVWVVSDWHEDRFFTGRKLKVDMGEFTTIGQVEGIDMYVPGKLFVANENNIYVSQSLYMLDLKSIK